MLRKPNGKILLSFTFAFYVHELFRARTGKSNEIIALVIGLLFYLLLGFMIYVFDWLDSKDRKENDEIIDSN